jgi:hypothetical protein
MKLFNQNYNIVVYIRRSADRIEEFKTFIERMIPLNNRTKWNNWYEIFIILFNKRK